MRTWTRTEEHSSLPTIPTSLEEREAMRSVASGLTSQENKFLVETTRRFDSVMAGGCQW